MRGVLYRTEKDGTTLAVPELRISASNSRTVYYENNAAKQSALNNNEIREGSIVLTGLAGNNEDYATKAYVDSKIGNLEHQVGIIVGFPGNVPNGYLLCDGNRFDKNKYPELYEYLGTDVLPDYRECVLVGAGQNTTNSIATHDVYTVGQFKDDQIQNITGSTRTGSSTNFFDDAYGCLYPIDQGDRGVPSSSGSWNVYKNIAFDASRVARAGAVTHGKQKGLNWAIKAAPITISSSPIQYQEGEGDANNWSGTLAEYETAEQVVDPDDPDYIKDKSGVDVYGLTAADLDIATEVREGDNQPVTSGAVYDYIDDSVKEYIRNQNILDTPSIVSTGSAEVTVTAQYDGYITFRGRANSNTDFYFYLNSNKIFESSNTYTTPITIPIHKGDIIKMRATGGNGLYILWYYKLRDYTGR